MAEKLSAKTALTTQPAKDDFLYIVDKSDTTDAASGTSKKIETNVLFSGLPKRVAGYTGYIIVPGPTSTDNSIAQVGDLIIGRGAFYGGNMIMGEINTASPSLDSHIDLYLNNAILP